jgi:hypothetical protein
LQLLAQQHVTVTHCKSTPALNIAAGSSHSRLLIWKQYNSKTQHMHILSAAGQNESLTSNNTKAAALLACWQQRTVSDLGQ